MCRRVPKRPSAAWTQQRQPRKQGLKGKQSCSQDCRSATGIMLSLTSMYKRTMELCANNDWRNCHSSAHEDCAHH